MTLFFLFWHLLQKVAPNLGDETRKMTFFLFFTFEVKQILAQTILKAYPLEQRGLNSVGSL